MFRRFFKLIAPAPWPLRTAFLAILCVYAICFGLLAFLVGPYDFNPLSTYYELAWRFWRDSPGLPQFNPLFCGGRTLGGDPQVPIFHPFTLLVGLFGSITVFRWEMLTQLGFGLWGLWYWLERWQVDIAGRLWGCLLFAAGGFTVARFLVGHVTLGYCFLLPLYFLLSYRACDANEPRRRESALALAVLCAYCGFYKPHFFLYGAPALAVEGVARSILSRRWMPALLTAGVITVAGLFSAAVLWPSSVYFAAFPRTSETGPAWVPVYSFFVNLLLPLKTIPKSWYGQAAILRHEYSVFVGPVAAVFACFGLRRIWPERSERLSLVVFGLASLWIGLGRSTESLSLWEPFGWLRAAWPGFASNRAPVRLWVGAYLAVIVFSAMGFSWPKKRKWQALIVAFGILPLLGQATVNLTKTSWLASQPQWHPPRSATLPLRQKHAHPDLPYDPIRQGIGVIECAENIESFRSPLLREGELLSTRADFPVTLQAQWHGWSDIELRGHSSRSGNVALNLNHHPYWQAEGGTRIVSDTGDPLTLAVSRGSFEARLYYRQPYVAHGLLVSLVTVFTLLGASFWIRRRRMGPRRIGLTGGIGVGKSIVGKMLEERGWWVVDLDAEARRLTDSDPHTRQEIAKIFGAGVFQGEALDRRKLRERVFSSKESRGALEALLHPKLMKIYEEKVSEARRRKIPAVVCEAALLVETGLYRRFDRLVVVTAPIEQRRRRVMDRDHITSAEFDQILASQHPESERIQAADWVIENNGSQEALRKAVNQVLAFA